MDSLVPCPSGPAFVTPELNTPELTRPTYLDSIGSRCALEVPPPVGITCLLAGSLRQGPA